jgi:hypothetical protein
MVPNLLHIVMNIPMKENKTDIRLSQGSIPTQNTVN